MHQRTPTAYDFDIRRFETALFFKNKTQHLDHKLLIKFIIATLFKFESSADFKSIIDRIQSRTNRQEYTQNLLCFQIFNKLTEKELNVVLLILIL